MIGLVLAAGERSGAVLADGDCPRPVDDPATIAAFIQELRDFPSAGPIAAADREVVSP